VPAPRRQRRKARGKPAEAELFAPDAPEPEPDVVLVPQAAPLATAGAAGDEDDLVFRAGCLILERKRVAVSMLQREFGLDFTQATALLDRLQASGLIGPYLGGQHRDILLTPQEWQERVGAG
jgi:DNA segregation ATPase FtsK/SpoIIIE-like protein